MNELFVCIKVDREERPDVDQIYMDTYDDAEIDDKTTPLVWAYHNPVEQAWERGKNSPSPSQSSGAPPLPPWPSP